MGEIHSLTGASAAVCGWNRGRVFFFLRARQWTFTHSLARPGFAFFFLLRARRVCGCVWLKKRAPFFFCSVRGGGKFTHSLAHPGARFFFCSVRGGGNSLTHWRVHGCVWFFLLFARRGKFTHSLARPGALFFFCCVRGGGHSLTHWRVRG